MSLFLKNDLYSSLGMSPLAAMYRSLTLASIYFVGGAALSAVAILPILSGVMKLILPMDSIRL